MRNSKKTVIHIIETLGEGGAQALIKVYARNMNTDYRIIVVTVYDTDSINIKQLRKLFLQE